MKSLSRLPSSSPVVQTGHNNNHPVIVGPVLDESPCPQQAFWGDVIGPDAYLIPWLTSPPPCLLLGTAAGGLAHPGREGSGGLLPEATRAGKLGPSVTWLLTLRCLS